MDVFDVLLVLVTGDSELQGGIFQHPDIISTPVFFFKIAWHNSYVLTDHLNKVRKKIEECY